MQTSRYFKFPHFQLNPLMRSTYPLFTVPPPLESLALEQLKERQSWLNRKRTKLCADLPRPHAFPGLPEPFLLEADEMAQVANTAGVANVEFWRQFCSRLRQFCDIITISDLVAIVTALKQADYRDTELMSLLVDEFIDDREELTLAEVESVLDAFTYFNITCDRLLLKKTNSVEDRLRAEIVKPDASLRVIADCVERLENFPVDLVKSVVQAKERDACSLGRIIARLGGIIDEATLSKLMSELLSRMVNESAGRDKSGSPPVISTLPPLVVGPELPKEYTRWPESPSLAELVDDKVEERVEQGDSIIFAETNEESEEVEEKGQREDQLMSYLLRRRSGADRVRKMSLDDMTNRDHIAQLGYWGLLAAIKVSSNAKSSNILDISLQLISSSLGGLDNKQLIAVGKIVKTSSMTVALPEQLVPQLKHEMRRRVSFLSEEERLSWAELV